MLKYLLDENLPPLYRDQLFRYLPTLVVRMVGDEGVPAKSTTRKFSADVRKMAFCSFPITAGLCQYIWRII